MSGYGRVCAFKVESDVFKAFHKKAGELQFTEGEILRGLMKSWVEGVTYNHCAVIGCARRKEVGK